MSPFKILLAEDSVEDIDLFREALEYENIPHHINTVNNGIDVLLYLKKVGQYKDAQSPDVIILDLNLPRKNGFEVLIEIREDVELKKIPLIVLTSANLSKEDLRGIQLHPQMYVKKSINFHSWMQVLTSINHLSEEVEIFTSQDKTVQAPLQEKEIRILLVEDNEEDVDYLRELLSIKQKYTWTIKHVDRVDQALQCLEQQSFDVLLLDLYLPDSQGFDTLVKVVSKKIKLPIIVMTSLRDETVGIEALRHGAQDYLVKGQFTADLFLRAVQYAIERQHLDRMKDDLINYIHHELNNPLTVIKESITQVVDGFKGEINEGQKTWLEMALHSVEHLEHMTGEFLESMRLDLGKIPLLKSDVNIVDLAKVLVIPFKSMASKKGLEIKESYSSEVIITNIDKERLQQIVTNLFINALKFTDHGFIEITIVDRGMMVECSVADTGKGIAAQDVPKVFGKFARFGQQTRTIKGTGLGLFICKQLVELHGGQIWVESQSGQGAKFIFKLPKKGD